MADGDASKRCHIVSKRAECNLATHLWLCLVLQRRCGIAVMIAVQPEAEQLSCDTSAAMLSVNCALLTAISQPDPRCHLESVGAAAAIAADSATALH